MLLFIGNQCHACDERNVVSIHHMLLFIVYGLSCLLILSEFQYITCYSLSKTDIQTTGETASFNTSHVTLYRKPTFHAWRKEPGFNTSHVTLYLRPKIDIIIRSEVSIHHMLLFIGGLFQSVAVTKSFNTSHVTLYRLGRGLYPARQYVSIHHMLLFIGEV